LAEFKKIRRLQLTVRRSAIPLSAVARQRHKIIRKRLALAAKQSVSGSPAQRRRFTQEDLLMRIYIIGNDGITLCREPPATIDTGEIAVASREEFRFLGGEQWLCPQRVTGGKTLNKHMSFGLLRIADMVESADSHRTG
jgi:hypothetical protein